MQRKVLRGEPFKRFAEALSLSLLQIRISI